MTETITPRDKEMAEIDLKEPAPKLTELLRRLIELKGSDLHITTHTPPRVRVNGDLMPLDDYAILSADDTKRLAYSILTRDQQRRFEESHELDLSFAVKGLSRFRVNVFDQRNGVGAVFRAIPFEVVPVDRLGLPPSVVRLCDRPNGLVLVTGPTGSGKSTTLASMLDKINRERPVHIITIEDPIEFIHGHKRGQVNQRQVGTNTRGFGEALRTVLREDPDIVLIGELRDLETIESALRVAETGHLTFGTLHTNTAYSTITRIVDVFPADRQPQVRTQLSNVLLGVVCQQLLPKEDGSGRVMALETMIPNAAIKNLIREDKVHQIYSVMSTGQEEHQMQTLNQSLARLVASGTVTLAAALLRSNDEEELREMVAHLGCAEHARVPPAGANRPTVRNSLFK